MGKSEAGVHGVAVEFEAVGESVRMGQVSGSDGGDPGGEFGVIAFGRGEEFGEVADQAGKLGQFGADGGEFWQQLSIAVTQPVGVGEQEAGQAARGDDGLVSFGSALGDVAVERFSPPSSAGLGRSSPTRV